DDMSPKVYQIETAMGADISLLKGATVIKVQSARFLPVKKCNDLLMIRSDNFIYKDNRFILSPNRCSGEITIDLDPKYFGKIDFFNERFAHGVPSLLDCESLTVIGDVCFENNVTIKGRIVIENKGESQAVVKEGSVVDGDLIFSK
ncbi:MAG: UTP--glucose-1-phosphate uridylyltransferase, partial [Desulfobacterales bacterium]